MTPSPARNVYRRAVSLLAAAVVAGTLLVAGAAPSVAERAYYDDTEPGTEAYFLAIDNARFTNTQKTFKVRAMHGGLIMEYVDIIEFYVQPRKQADPRVQVRYVLMWVRGEGVTLYHAVPGNGGYRRLKCAGDKLTRVDADFEAGTSGHVTGTIPRKCLPRKIGTVRMLYQIINLGGGVMDAAPGLNTSKYIRWLKRG